MRFTHRSGDERELHVRFNFDRKDVRLEHSLIGVVVHLRDFPTVGEPGAPALPQCVVRVALPPHGKLAGVRVKAGHVVRLSDEPVPVAPLQPSRPGAYHRPGEEKIRIDPKRLPDDPRGERKQDVERFPIPPYVSPDRELYADASRRPPARVLKTSVEGFNTVVTLELNPLRLDENGRLELTAQIDVVILHERDEQLGRHKTPPDVVSRAQAQRQVALTRRSVLNADFVLDYSGLYPLFLQADYLIITDNQQWDPVSITPAGAAGGDLVASFRRLTDWKRVRGLQARVVTITDIVGGRFGNFRTGSRDLQEVIRRFLQMAQSDWGVAWVLLGGDTEIVPVRRIAGSREGGIRRQTDNPPPDNKSFWTGSHLRVHAVNPGVWWGASTANLLVRPDNGLLIPYDPAGTSSATTRGWYFTTDETYTTRSTTPTDFVRVNGPASQVNAEVQFLYEWNIVPTDLYYSSLVGPGYKVPGKHDWDLLDNGVYGQHAAGNELDGVNYTPTISVGRAPVHSAAEADVFVDKVIAYEKFERPDGTPLDESWPKRVLIVSENWGGRTWIGHSPNDPPDDDTYHHGAAAFTVVKLKDVPEYTASLLAYVAEDDVRLIPYRTDASATVRGWYFARGAGDVSPNILFIPLGGGAVFPLPMASQWITVFGTAAELEPTGYLLNDVVEDGSLADQEQLRVQMRSEMPGFYSVERLYEDVQDMTPAQIAADPVDLITSDRLREKLDAGPHIVSLSGHGSSNGCCKLSRDLADGLTNGFHTFILYADSCLTNQFDSDSMSEHLLKNGNGGAVAYIGSTRFSWIGCGDDIQRRVFHEWAALAGDAHIGLLFDTRSTILDSLWWADGRWSMFSLNLMGDPEMPLWWRQPLDFRIPDLIPIDVFEIPKPDPPDLRFQAPYLDNWGRTFVHIQQGKREELLLADANGRVEVPRNTFQRGAATMTITRPGYKPVIKQVTLAQPTLKGGRGTRLFD
jgi:hypothetical protein